MGLAFSNQKPNTNGKFKQTITTVTFDSVYPSGGEAISPADLGLSVIDHVSINITSIGATTGNVAYVAYVPSTGKLKVYDEAHAEVTASDDLSTLVVQIVANGH